MGAGERDEVEEDGYNINDKRGAIWNGNLRPVLKKKKNTNGVEGGLCAFRP